MLDRTDEIEAETIAGFGLDVVLADTLATELGGGTVELPAARAVLAYRSRVARRPHRGMTCPGGSPSEEGR